MEETITRRLEAGCCLAGVQTPAVTPTRGDGEQERTPVQRCFFSFLNALIGAHCFLTVITGAFLFTHLAVIDEEMRQFSNRTAADYMIKEPNTQIIASGALLAANLATTVSLIIVCCVNQIRFTRAAFGWCSLLCLGSLAAFISARDHLDVYTTDSLLLSTALLAFIESVSMFIRAFYQRCCDPTHDVSTARAPTEPSLSAKSTQQSTRPSR